jgi:hypothetical protein
VTPARGYIEQLVATLPPGQRRVAGALIGVAMAPTYRAVADHLGLSLGTVHRHLGRIRRRHPALYGELMCVRHAQLAERHREAQRRAECRSATWHRSQSARRYYYRFGRWPWECRG